MLRLRHVLYCKNVQIYPDSRLCALVRIWFWSICCFLKAVATVQNHRVIFNTFASGWFWQFSQKKQQFSVGTYHKTGHVRPAIKRPGTFDRQFERLAQRWTGNTQDRRNVRPAVHNTVRAKNSTSWTNSGSGRILLYKRQTQQQLYNSNDSSPGAL